jgi:heptosyltransferase I
MPSPRILIVRLSAIGDVIQSMPIACALRDRFPEAFLAWAVELPAGQLLHGHPALDRIVQLPHGG